MYQGADGDLIKAAADAGAKGIVIAGAGAGATSGTQQDGMTLRGEERRVRRHDDPHGQRTDCAAARQRVEDARPPAAGRARTPDEQRRRIAGEDLAPVKARVLLMLALTRTQDPGEIQRIFSEY